MNRTNWLTNLLNRTSTDDRAAALRSERLPGQDDVDEVLRRSAPHVQALSVETSSRILAAALADSGQPARLPLPRRLVPAFSFAIVVVGIVLWSHFTSPRPPAMNLAKNQTPPAPSAQSGVASDIQAIEQPPSVIKGSNGSTKHRTTNRNSVGASRHIRKHGAARTNSGQSPQQHPTYTGPASQAQLARVLVVSAQQPPIKVVSHNAELSDRGFARVSAYAAPNAGSGAMLEYTVAGPASGVAQTSFSLTAASSDSREALLKVAVDKAGPSQSEGSN